MPLAPQPAALGRVSTVDALAAELTRRILASGYSPGAPLREADLASEFEVARHTVRYALQVLISTGLVQHRPNRGMYVSEMTHEDRQDISRLRLALEVEAVRELTIRPDPAPLLQPARDSLRAATTAAPWRERLEADLAVHRAIVNAVGSRRLTRVYEDLQMELRYYLLQSPESIGAAPLSAWRAQHEELLTAIEAGDTRAAETIVRDHIRPAWS